MGSFVLVVDDDEVMRSVVVNVLSDEGFDAREASDGKEALAVLKREPLPRLVLLDLMMPGVSGWQVIDEMSATPRTARVPVVILTSLDKSDDLPTSHLVLHKPIERELLLDTVRSHAAP